MNGYPPDEFYYIFDTLVEANDAISSIEGISGLPFGDALQRTGLDNKWAVKYMESSPDWYVNIPENTPLEHFELTWYADTGE